MAFHAARDALHPAPSPFYVGPDEPRPGWFVARGNGIYVPLIALDDMPNNIHFPHIPRYLTGNQTSGMEFLGEYPSSGLKHHAIFSPEFVAGRSPGLTSPHTGASSKRISPRLAMSTYATNAEHAPSLAHLDHNMGHISLADGPSAVKQDQVFESAHPPTVRPLPPSGREPNQSKKEYCSHWIRTGECDYMQQGCIYKHIMPDLATLNKIGFRGVPAWWKKQRTKKGTDGATADKGQQQTPESLRSETTLSKSTDTGSLHLGNPDSKRFLRTNLGRMIMSESKNSAPAMAKSDSVESGGSSSPNTGVSSPSAEEELRHINTTIPPLVPQTPRIKTAHEDAYDLFLVSPSQIHKPRFTRAVFKSGAGGAKGMPRSGTQGSGGQSKRAAKKAKPSKGDRFY